MSRTDIVLFSAIFGRKEPPNPLVFGPFDSCRKVMFTDLPDLEIPGVEVIRTPLIDGDPARTSRHAKLQPHLAFPEARWTIYLDNKSRLLVDPMTVIDAVETLPDIDFFAFPHFRRTCLYDEAKTVIQNGFDDPRRVRRQIRRYRREGMPKGFGLIEGHFLVRRPTPAVAAFGEAWFREVMTESRRDQIAFPYLAWKLGLRHAAPPGLVWSQTVEHSHLDRANRVPDYRPVSPLYVAARRVYHRLRGKG